MVTVVVPTASNTPTLTTTAVFAFVHAIIFNAPFTRVKVEPLAAAPFATATAEIIFAKPAGAACTEFAEIAPAMSVADSVTPRLVILQAGYAEMWILGAAAMP